MVPSFQISASNKATTLAPFSRFLQILCFKKKNMFLKVLKIVAAKTV